MITGMEIRSNNIRVFYPFKRSIADKAGVLRLLPNMIIPNVKKNFTHPNDNLGSLDKFIRKKTTEIGRDWPMITSNKFSDFYLKQLSLCNIRTEKNDNNESLESRIEMVNDIFLLFQRSKLLNALSQDLKRKTINFLSENLIRVIPDFDERLYSSEEIPSGINFEWMIREKCYKILIYIIKTKPKTIENAKMLIYDLFSVLNTTNIAERKLQIETIENILKTHTGQIKRFFLISGICIRNHLYLLPIPYTIQTILRLISLSFSTIMDQQTWEFFSKLYCEYIIKLTTNKYLIFFNQELISVSKLFMDVGKHKSIQFVLQYTFSHWTIGMNANFFGFASLLVAALTNNKLFPYQKDDIHKIISVIKEGITSINEQISIYILQKIQLQPLKGIIERHTNAFLPQLVPKIRQISTTHWSSLVKTEARGSLAFLSSISGSDTIIMTQLSNEKSTNWILITKAASEMYQDFDQRKKIMEISREFLDN